MHCMHLEASFGIFVTSNWFSDFFATPNTHFYGVKSQKAGRQLSEQFPVSSGEILKQTAPKNLRHEVDTITLVERLQQQLEVAKTHLQGGGSPVRTFSVDFFFYNFHSLTRKKS